MFDLIKKTMLLGIGVAAVTKDKAEELVKELVAKGKMSEKEGKELINEILNKAEQAKKDLETKVENTVRKVLSKLAVATKEDIAELKQEIANLNQEKKADND